jgi:Domain of unknown function (DUF4336)
MYHYYRYSTTNAVSCGELLLLLRLLEYALIFLVLNIHVTSISTSITVADAVAAFVVVSHNGRSNTHTTNTGRIMLHHSHNNVNDEIEVPVLRRYVEGNETKELFHAVLPSLDIQRRSIIAFTIASSMATGVPTRNVVHAALPLPQQRSEVSQLLIPNPIRNDDLYWPLGKVAFSLLPIAGTYTRRVTVEQEIVPRTIWTHDQIQGIVNVNVPIRQTVVRLGTDETSGGGLWVHNPVAPTKQLLQMMDRLVQQCGPVRHIVLGTVALEHKATVASFASHFPRATVWIQPGQWSFPINLPIEYYGLQKQLLAHRLLELPRITTTPAVTPTTTKTTSRYKKRPSRYTTGISADPILPEWYNEIEYEMLGPFTFKAVGGYSESAFYHKNTSTLIVTDCVVSVTKDPPPIVQEDPRALIYHSRDTADERISNNDGDTMERRLKGWRRMVQFGLVFFPSQITVTPTIGKVLDDIQSVPYNLRNLGTDAIPFNSALYPWSWNANDTDQMNFDYISQNGTLFCPPILTKLILDREPTATLQFVDRVCQRFSTMKRIIPCHLNNNVAVTDANEFYHAFDMLRSQPTSPSYRPQRALAEDLALLQKASDVLTQYNIIAPSLVCDGEPARQVGRFAGTTTTKTGPVPQR